MRFKLKAAPIHFLEVLSFPLTLLFFQPSRGSIFLGLIFSLIGLSIKLWLFAYPKIRNRKFEVYGPYRFIRHPYFFSTLMLLVAASIAGRSILIFVLGTIAFSFLFVRESGQIDMNRKRFFGIDYTYYKNCISSLVPSLIPYPSISQKNISIKNVFNVRYKAELDSFLIVPIFFTYGLVYLEWHKFRELGSVVAVAILCLTLIWLFRHVEIRKTKDNSNEVPT